MTAGVWRVERAEATAASASAEQRFARLYGELFRPLVGYCHRLVGDQQLAADIAQEAFTRLFARVVSVREPKGWLYLVATNLCNDAWRQDERQRSLVARLGWRASTSTPGHDPSMRDLVRRLPARLRDVVVLHYYADLPIADVARALGKPEGTVKRRLLEARGLLAADVRSSQ